MFKISPGGGILSDIWSEICFMATRQEPFNIFSMVKKDNLSSSKDHLENSNLYFTCQNKSILHKE